MYGRAVEFGGPRLAPEDLPTISNFTMPSFSHPALLQDVLLLFSVPPLSTRFQLGDIHAYHYPVCQG